MYSLISFLAIILSRSAKKEKLKEPKPKRMVQAFYNAPYFCLELFFLLGGSCNCNRSLIPLLRGWCISVDTPGGLTLGEFKHMIQID